MSLKYSKDGKVSFNPLNHAYRRVSDNKYLHSITKTVNKYKIPFDAEATATRYAAKHGLDKTELLATWQNEGDISRENGHAVHAVIENYILKGEIVTTGLYEKEVPAVQFIKHYFESGKLIPVETEMIVYNDSLAGQIDCIAKSPNGEHYIFDWKTCKKITDNSYNRYMHPPFQCCPDANFFHYSLQLGFYKELCKEYDIAGSYIVHLDSPGYKIIKAANIEIPDYVLQ